MRAEVKAQTKTRSLVSDAKERYANDEIINSVLLNYTHECKYYVNPLNSFLLNPAVWFLLFTRPVLWIYLQNKWQITEIRQASIKVIFLPGSLLSFKVLIFGELHGNQWGPIWSQHHRIHPNLYSLHKTQRSACTFMINKGRLCVTQCVSFYYICHKHLTKLSQHRLTLTH